MVHDQAPGTQQFWAYAPAPPPLPPVPLSALQGDSALDLGSGDLLPDLPDLPTA